MDEPGPSKATKIDQFFSCAPSVNGQSGRTSSASRETDQSQSSGEARSAIDSESEVLDGADSTQCSAGCSSVHISLNIEIFQKLVLEVLKQGAFNIHGSRNGHGLNGTMKRNQLSVIHVAWLLF